MSDLLPICATCPWLVQNHGLKKPVGWYSTTNLRRLWQGLRTGRAPGVLCHASDPNNQDYGGTAAIKPGHERPCAGALTVIFRNMNAISEGEPQPFQPPLTKPAIAHYLWLGLSGQAPSLDATRIDDVGLPWVDDFENVQAEIERRIVLHGFTLRYVDYCEDARTPGLAGQMRGVTDWERREIKIGRKANRSQGAIINILHHELRHLDEPTWDCGNRDVFGRG